MFTRFSSDFSVEALIWTYKPFYKKFEIYIVNSVMKFCKILIYNYQEIEQIIKNKNLYIYILKFLTIYSIFNKFFIINKIKPKS